MLLDGMAPAQHQGWLLLFKLETSSAPSQVHCGQSISGPPHWSVRL